MGSPLRTIVCPTDFSEPSAHALSEAADLAGRMNADLHLVHAWETPVYVYPDGPLVAQPPMGRQLEAELRSALEQQAKTLSARGLRVHTHLAQGRPHEVIAKVAKEVDADLVVLGTHGRGGIARFLLGSVAERVVRTSEVPVLTVRMTPESDAASA